jgi:hypothetical protein
VGRWAGRGASGGGQLANSPARYNPKKADDPTRAAAAGAIKYSPRQLTNMCDPLECEKHAVSNVHIRPAMMLFSFRMKFLVSH